MHSIKSAFLLAGVVFLNISLFAQKDAPAKTEKKVIIIKKTDINGNVNEERIEATGDDADRLMREMEIDNEGSKTITSDKTVNVTIDDDKKQTIKIITKKNGKEEVMEWTGQEGEMPAELNDQIKSININKDGDKDGKKMVMITLDADDIEKNDAKGQKMIFIADGEEIDIDDSEGPRRDKNGKIDKRYKKIDKSANDVKLGVMIEDDSEGAQVSDIVDGSAAAKAGIRRDDIILKVGDAYVFSLDGLLKSLRPYKKGDKTKVTVIRGGKEKKMNVVF